MEEENARLVTLSDELEAQAMTAEVEQESLKIDLATRYDQWEERGRAIEQLEAKVKKLTALSHGRDEVIGRMTSN